MERLDIIDAHDKLLGEDTRERVHSKEMLHRGILVMVFDPKGKLYVQRRSRNKKVFPGKLEGSLSGHVRAGEEYSQAAVRELREELSIITTPAKLDEITKFGIHIPGERMLVKLFVLKDYKGKAATTSHEVAEGEFVPIEKVREMILESEEEFTPPAIKALKLFFELDGNPRAYHPV